MFYVRFFFIVFVEMFVFFFRVGNVNFLVFVYIIVESVGFKFCVFIELIFV